MFSKQGLFVFLALAVSFSLVGCHEEEKITRATRPRVNDMKRVLGAIVPPDMVNRKGEKPKTWFFLMVGSESEVGPRLEPFHAFVQSLQLDASSNPGWKLPADWTEQKDEGKKRDYRLIRTGPDDKAPLLTVSARKWDRMADNVNYWRLHLGLKGIDVVDQELFVRPESIHGRRVLFVDMTGPHGVPTLRPLEEDKIPFQYQTPEQWEEIPPTNKLYVLSFMAGDQEQRVDINISVFPGGGGGLAANINRWRKQIELGPSSAEQISALPEVIIGDAKGKLVDITGPAPAPVANHIVGAVLLRKEDALFFKMSGRGESVAKQKPAFESFLKSVQFGG